MKRLKGRSSDAATPKKFVNRQAKVLELVEHIENGGCVIEKKSDELYTKECLTPFVVNDLIANPEDYEILPAIKGT